MLTCGNCRYEASPEEFLQIQSFWGLGESNKVCCPNCGVVLQRRRIQGELTVLAHVQPYLCQPVKAKVLVRGRKRIPLRLNVTSA